jgi:hypothetical protein
MALRYGKLKGSVKVKVLPIFYEPLPFGYGFIQGTPETLEEWQISHNRELSTLYTNPETVPAIHLVDNVCALNSHFLFLL